MIENYRIIIETRITYLLLSGVWSDNPSLLYRLAFLPIKDAIQSLLARPGSLPFAQNEYDAVYSFIALDTVHDPISRLSCQNSSASRLAPIPPQV